jgi:arylsulfatase A-like enzyme
MHEYLYWEDDEQQRAVRSGPWKAVRKKPGGPVRLYNLDSDEGEQNDLAREMPDVARRLEGYLDAAHEEARPQREPAPPKGRKFQ